MGSLQRQVAFLQVVYEFDIQPLKEDSQEGRDGRNEVVLQTEKLIGEIRNITNVQENNAENKIVNNDGTEVKENLMDIVKQNINKR